MIELAIQMTKKLVGLHSPYENIVIGNFLYGVGLAIGLRSRGNVPPASTNLLQQTPLDESLADVLFDTSGIVRLLEFKRSKNRDTKEVSKHAAITVALSPHANLQKISRKVHWYVESMPWSEDQAAPVKVCPYLEMNSASRRLTTLDAFVNEIADSALAPSAEEPPREAIQEYLDCISELAGTGSASGAGFIIHVTKNGKVSYAGLADIRDLRRMHRDLILRDVDLHNMIQHDREQAYSLEQAITRKAAKVRGYEPGL